jgi:hypothetical protein
LGAIQCVRDKQKQEKVNLVGRDHIADQGIEETIVQKKIFMKCIMKMWTGLKLLRTDFSYGLK